MRSATSYWWNDDKDEAIAEFTKVAEASRAESDLRLELAELLEQQGEPRRGAGRWPTPSSRWTTPRMKRREELALRLAVLTGNLERARQAAERLFGLRLDTDTQVRLAGQMHQLGLHELAEAVLGRARRRAGNKAAALVGLMLQYQRQDKLDVAVQVAMQILRSTTATRQTNPNVYNADNPDAARMAAIGVLLALRPAARSSSTRPRSSSRRRRTPSSSTRRWPTTTRPPASATRPAPSWPRSSSSAPTTLTLRFQVAQQLVQEGQAAAAIEHYKVILKKDPSVALAVLLPGPSNAFQQANKTRGAARPVRDRWTSASSGIRTTSSTPCPHFLNDDKLRDRAMPLFRKAWDAFPDYRSYLFGYIRGEAIWKYPEIYDYALEARSSRGRRRSRPDMQWEALRRHPLLRPRRPDDDRGLASCSTWPPRRAGSTSSRRRSTPPARRCRTGRPATSSGPWSTAASAASTGPGELITGFLDETRDESLSTNVFATIGSRAGGPLRDPRAGAGRLRGQHLSPVHRHVTSRLDFDNGCVRRLVAIYMREDRPEDARRILLDFINVRRWTLGLRPGVRSSRCGSQGLHTVAGKLAELGFAADAVAATARPWPSTARSADDARTTSAIASEIVRQCREGISRTLDGLKDDELKATLDRLLVAGKTAEPAKAEGEAGVGRKRRRSPRRRST